MDLYKQNVKYMNDMFIIKYKYSSRKIPKQYRTLQDLEMHTLHITNLEGKKTPEH